MIAIKQSYLGFNKSFVMYLIRSDEMAINQYIEQLKKREIVYKKRVQYCLLFMLLSVLPMTTLFTEIEGFYIKSFSTLTKQFGEIGLSVLCTFIILIALVGLRHLWKLNKISKLLASRGLSIDSSGSARTVVL